MFRNEENNAETAIKIKRRNGDLLLIQIRPHVLKYKSYLKLFCLWGSYTSLIPPASSQFQSSTSHILALVKSLPCFK